MNDSSFRCMSDIMIGDVLDGGIQVNVILQIRNVHNVPFYKVKREDTHDYIYVTGSHKVKRGDTFIYVRDDPDSVITDVVEPTWICLITDNHVIPIGGHAFFDWSDMCDACEKSTI